MRGRSAVVPAIVLAIAVALSGCSAPDSHCSVGYSPLFNVTVVDGSNPELSLRFCDSEQCSPVPEPGPIPAYLTDRSDQRGAFLRHLSRDTWSVRPGGDGRPPRTAQISLYRNGVLVKTTSVHLDWPDVDPCATIPPPLRITIRSS